MTTLARDKMARGSLIAEFKRLADMTSEASLAATILGYARSGHATPLMIEQAIVLIDKHIAYATETNDCGWLNASAGLKVRLEKALVDGVATLRVISGPGPEFLLVEQPLARTRAAQGHQIRQQVRCAAGVVDIYDLTADELIECKAVGDCASLGEAAGQLQRYRKSFPGACLTIAVSNIHPDAFWLAEILRQQGISVIEMGPR